MRFLELFLLNIGREKRQTITTTTMKDDTVLDLCPLLIIYLFYAIPVDQGTHRLYIEKDSSTKKQGNNRFADEKTVFC